MDKKNSRLGVEPDHFAPRKGPDQNHQKDERGQAPCCKCGHKNCSGSCGCDPKTCGCRNCGCAK